MRGQAEVTKSGVSSAVQTAESEAKFVFEWHNALLRLAVLCSRILRCCIVPNVVGWRAGVFAHSRTCFIVLLTLL